MNPSIGDNPLQKRSLADKLRATYFHPRFLAYRELRKIIQKEGNGMVGILLDVGCGKKPYLDLLPNVKSYIGLDVPVSMHGMGSVDVLGTNIYLPFADESFDCVLCTEVLEHAPDPRLVLEEMNRVSKSGGRLLLTVPFSEQLHEEPYDFYRFTIYGIESLLARSGWKVERIHKRGGTFLELGYRTSSFLYSAAGAWKDGSGHLHPKTLAAPFIIGLCAIIQVIGSAFDQIWKVDLSTIGYGIVARKALKGNNS